jgi:hypothetical protein
VQVLFSSTSCSSTRPAIAAAVGELALAPAAPHEVGVLMSAVAAA